MDEYLTVFALRRNVDTGELELDMYAQYNATQLQGERDANRVVAALEGKSDWVDPTKSVDLALHHMKLRTRMDHAITGLYAFRAPQEWTRDDFWALYQGVPLSELKQFRI